MYVEPSRGETLLHANIYQDNGEICHPILDKKEYQQFSPTFSTILKKINELLYEPNLKNAANIWLAELYKKDEQEYHRRINENAKLLEQDE